MRSRGITARAKSAVSRLVGRRPAARGASAPGQRTPDAARRLRLGRGAWVVDKRDDSPMRAERLSAETWLLTRRPKRVTRRIGPPRLRTHVVTEERAFGGKSSLYQRSVLDHVADEHVAWVLRRLAINCVIDVGANRGQFGRMLRRRGYTGRIVSFEPLAQVAEKLEKRAADDPDWWVMPYALGDASSETAIQVAG